MYTICILSRPDEFTQSVYREMHKGTIPDNIKWVGYSDFLDLDSIESTFKSHGRKVVFDERPLIEKCMELDVEDRGNFIITVTERTADGISGYVGKIRISEPAEASKRLVKLSETIDDETLPDCMLTCMKEIQSIDRSITVMTETRLGLLSLIPGLSLYTLGQTGKAVIFAGLFVLSVILTAFSIIAQCPEGDVGGSVLLILVTYFLTLFECEYVCYGKDAPWYSDDVRGLLLLILGPIFSIAYAILGGSSLLFIIIPMSAGILIYILVTALNIRKHTPLKDYKIIKSNW